MRRSASIPVTRRGFLAGTAALALPLPAFSAGPGRLVALTASGEPESVLARLAAERPDLVGEGATVLHVSRRATGPLPFAVVSLDPGALRLLPADRIAGWLGRPGRVAPAGAGGSEAPDWAALGRLLAHPAVPRLALVGPCEAAEAGAAVLRAALGASADVRLLREEAAGGGW